MFTPEELKEIEALCKKSKEVKKVYDFWKSSQSDAVKLIRLTLNSQLLVLNEDLSKPDCNYDFTLDRINEISRTLKKLPKDVKAMSEYPGRWKNSKLASSKSDSGSFLDNHADDDRNK